MLGICQKFIIELDITSLRVERYVLLCMAIFRVNNISVPERHKLQENLIL